MPYVYMYLCIYVLAITTLCPNANIDNTKIRMFAAIIVRLILKLRGLYVNFCLYLIVYRLFRLFVYELYLCTLHIKCI